MSFSMKSGLFASIIALLAAAGSARAALVQVDVSGTYSGNVFPAGTVLDAPYNARLIYDSDSLPLSSNTYPLQSFGDNTFTLAQPGTLTLFNDIDTGSSLVDRMVFFTEYANEYGQINSEVSLDFTNDFFPVSGLPTLGEFTAALGAGMFVSGDGSGEGVFLGNPLIHDADLDEISVAPVPEPTSLGLLGAIGTLALRRGRKN